MVAEHEGVEMGMVGRQGLGPEPPSDVGVGTLYDLTVAAASEEAGGGGGEQQFQDLEVQARVTQEGLWAGSS